MDSYEVILTDDAVYDLLVLRDYVAFTLCAPRSALSLIRKIRADIDSLHLMPERIKKIEEEPWHSKDIRRMFSNNFYIYFRIDERSGHVFVLNIIYSKRDQLKLFSLPDSGQMPGS